MARGDATTAHSAGRGARGRNLCLGLLPAATGGGNGRCSGGAARGAREVADRRAVAPAPALNGQRGRTIGPRGGAGGRVRFGKRVPGGAGYVARRAVAPVVDGRRLGLRKAAGALSPGARAIERSGAEAPGRSGVRARGGSGSALGGRWVGPGRLWPSSSPRTLAGDPARPGRGSALRRSAAAQRSWGVRSRRRADLGRAVDGGVLAGRLAFRAHRLGRVLRLRGLAVRRPLGRHLLVIPLVDRLKCGAGCWVRSGRGEGRGASILRRELARGKGPPFSGCGSPREAVSRPRPWSKSTARRRIRGWLQGWARAGRAWGDVRMSSRYVCVCAIVK
jgi:hypothetical protein